MREQDTEIEWLKDSVNCAVLPSPHRFRPNRVAHTKIVPPARTFAPVTFWGEVPLRR
jgi:hypothetical protein